MSVSHEQEQSGHGREVDPADIEFEMWWDRDSGWGGERLAEYQLAREAFKFGMRIAELEAKEQWVRVADKEPPKGVEVWINGPLFELRATLDVVDYNEMAQKSCWGWVLSNRSLMLDDDLEVDSWRYITPPTEGEG